MYHESGGGGVDDNELVKERWDYGERNSSSTGCRSFLRSLFHRRCEAWPKERLLTFKEECKGGRARMTTSEERVLRWGWREMIRSYRKVRWWWGLC